LGISTYKIKIQKNNNNNTKCQLMKYPEVPIFVPINSPKAPGATNMPGALALLGVRLRLMLPPPTWKQALPSPAKHIPKNNDSWKIIEAIARVIHPIIAN